MHTPTKLTKKEKKMARTLHHIFAVVAFALLVASACHGFAVSLEGSPSSVAVGSAVTVNYSGFSRYPMVMVTITDLNSHAQIVRMGSGPVGSLPIQMCCMGNTTASVTVSALGDSRASAELATPMTVTAP